MAGKLISLEDAAKMLGVTPDELGEMRQRSEIYGYRDGGNWKFKQEDVERVQQGRSQQGIFGGSTSGDEMTIDLPLSHSGIDMPLDLGDSKQDVVLSELELGESGPGSSTIIGGKKGAASGDADIDLKIGGDSGLSLLAGSSGGSTMGAPVGPGAQGSAAPSGSDINLAGPSGLNLMGSSDVRLAPSNSPKGSGLDASNVLAGGSSGSGGGGQGGKTMLTAELADRPLDSSVKLTLRDSESVFGDEGGGGRGNIHESGINLLDAHDSGLALDDLSLAASSGPGRKKKGASDLGMQGEDDFLLTPLEEQADDSTDSGSQVIALEGEFGDDATATLLAGDVPGLSDMLQEAGGGGPSPAGMQMGGAQYVTAPEPSYGAITVALLGLSSTVMLLVGIMMYDIVRNMWSWDTPYSFNSSLMDMILGMTGG